MEMTDVCEQLYKARLARVLGIGVPPTTVASFSHFKASGGSVKSNSQLHSSAHAEQGLRSNMDIYPRNEQVKQQNKLVRIIIHHKTCVNMYINVHTGTS